MDLLSELVSINTVNDPLNNIRPSREDANFIANILEEWGLSPEIIDSNGYYSVFGSIGKGDPCLLLLAHYDTVPADPSKWSYDPFKLTIVGDKAFGRGALDDKSNVAALMLVLKELANKSINCTIYYGFTGDEEIGGANGAAVIAEKLRAENKLPRFLINADGYGMKIIHKRRKAFSIIIEVEEEKKKVKGVLKEKTFTANYPVKQHAHAAYFLPGVDTHPLLAASVFTREENVCVESIEGEFLKSNVVPASVSMKYIELGSGEKEYECDNGLTNLLKIVYPLTRLSIPTERPSEYGVTITPNIYVKQDRLHRIYFDLRAMLKDKSVIEDEVAKLLIEVFPKAKYIVRTGRGAYLYTPPISPIVKAFKNALKFMGEEPRLVEGAGASDSRYFTIHGVEAVDFGPRGGNIHGVNEFVEISSLKKLPYIYLKVVEELTKYFIETSK